MKVSSKMVSCMEMVRWILQIKKLKKDISIRGSISNNAKGLHRSKQKDIWKLSVNNSNMLITLMI